jgi:hypothetical protein
VDEWHKAAFYDPSPAALPSASYWIYASKSRVPSSTQINYAGANYGSLTPVGTPGVASYFGTFGQSGNAAEWTEDIYQDPVTRVIFRVVAGGNWASPSNAVSSQGYVNTLPTGPVATEGFRVASITGMPLAPPRAQTITFTQPAAQTFVPNRTFALSATAPGGAVAFTSGNTNVISIVGATATIRGVGTVVITANQGGNANFAAAPAVTRSVTVNKGSQTITFTPPATQTFVPNRTFALSATAPGGAVAFTSGNTNVISVSGSTATMRGAGTAVITANQAGNANYAAAPAVTRSVTVNKGSQTISFNPPATNTYVANGTLSFPTTASSGLTIVYTSSNTNVLTVSGATATMKAKGTVNVTASQSGNTNFNAATPVIRTITLR